MKKVRYYTLTGFTEQLNTVAISVSSKSYAATTFNSFGMKTKRALKEGDRVRISNMESSVINASEGHKLAIVRAVHYGKPVTLELPNGEIIEVFGLIIELLPLLEKLWLIIKDVFKKQ